ncbi:30S ribosomal protein S6, partial [Durusdinium trenchii]
MKAHLPVAVLNMMENGTWSGVSLIQLSSDVTKPTCDELAQNHCLLKPLVLSFPKAVPSAYMLTDCYLYLDRLLDKKVFKPQQDESRMVMAGREGVKAKRKIALLKLLVLWLMALMMLLKVGGGDDVGGNDSPADAADHCESGGEEASDGEGSHGEFSGGEDSD